MNAVPILVPVVWVLLFLMLRLSYNRTKLYAKRSPISLETKAWNFSSGPAFVGAGFPLSLFSSSFSICSLHHRSTPSSICKRFLIWRDFPGESIVDRRRRSWTYFGAAARPTEWRWQSGSAFRVWGFPDLIFLFKISGESSLDGGAWRGQRPPPLRIFTPARRWDYRRRVLTASRRKLRPLVFRDDTYWGLRRRSGQPEKRALFGVRGGALHPSAGFDAVTRSGGMSFTLLDA